LRTRIFVFSPQLLVYEKLYAIIYSLHKKQAAAELLKIPTEFLFCLDINALLLLEEFRTPYILAALILRIFGGVICQGRNVFYIFYILPVLPFCLLLL